MVSDYAFLPRWYFKIINSLEKMSVLNVSLYFSLNRVQKNTWKANSSVLSCIFTLVLIFGSEKFTAKEVSIPFITSVYSEKISRTVIDLKVRSQRMNKIGNKIEKNVWPKGIIFIILPEAADVHGFRFTFLTWI